MSGVFDLRPLLTTYVNDPLLMSHKDAEMNSPILLGKKIANNLLMRVSNIHLPNSSLNWITHSKFY